MHHRGGRPARVTRPADDAGQLHVLRQPLDGRALLRSTTPLARTAIALLRRVYARSLDPAIAASALAALGFVSADRRPHPPQHVMAEAKLMVAWLLDAARAVEADPVDPLS